MEPTSFDEIRRGLLGHPRTRQGHGRQRRPGIPVLPLVPAVLRPALRPHRGQGRRLGHAAGLQRLAHRRVVRHLPRALHPLRAARDLGSRGVRRRGAAHRRQGRPRRDVLGEPVQARLAQHPLRSLGPVLDRVLRRERRRVHAHRIVVAAGDHGTRRPHRLPDHAHAHEHRAGGGRPGVVARAAQVPPVEHRALRGWHRLDPVLPRAGRLQLRAPPPLDGAGLRRPAAERGVQRARHHVLHRRPLRRGQPRVPQHGPGVLGVRLPALRLDVADGAGDPRQAARRRVRPRHRPHHPPERDAAVQLRSVQRPAPRGVHCRRPAPAGGGPRRQHPLHQPIARRRPQGAVHRPGRPCPGARRRSTAWSRPRSTRSGAAAGTSTSASRTWTPTASWDPCASPRSPSSAASSSPAPRTRTSPWPCCRPTTTGTSTSGAAPTPGASSPACSPRSGIPRHAPPRCGAPRPRAPTR